MTLVKQALTAAAILALAIVIVDCNRTLQEVLEEQADRQAAKQADLLSGELSGVVEPTFREPRQQHSTAADSQPAGAPAEQSADCKCAQVEEQPTSVADVAEPQEASAPSPSKRQSKSKKDKVTSTLPEEPEFEGAESAAEDKSYSERKKLERQEEAKLKPNQKEGGEAKITEKKLPKFPEVEDKTLVDGAAEEQVASEPASEKENVEKRPPVKTKVGKKSKTEAKKRDKRETKKSGSSKNGKTKRSAKKSKYNKNKSKSRK